MHNLKGDRGSVFIVAMIFAAIVAIALTSFLQLSLSATRLANRSYYMNAAQNLVDTGFEQALWSLNNNNTTHPYPQNWTNGGFDNPGGNIHKGIFPSSSTYYTLSGGATGQVKVWINLVNATEDIWHAVARATVTLGDGSKLNKFAECYLQQRSFSGGGMVTRNGVTFNGDVYLDSWISGGSAGANIPYSIGVQRANARLASPSLISLANADVYGYVAIGSDTISSSSLTVGATGRVGNFSQANGTIDTTRITYDFVGDFPNVQDVPTSGAVLPAAVTSGGTTTVSITTSQTYLVSDLDFTGGGAIDVLNIGAVGSPVNAVIVVPGWVDMGGGDTISIAPGSTLVMYVGGYFQMTGTTARIDNGTSGLPNNADAFVLLGTRTEEQIASGMAYQVWNLQGGNFLSATIYAPNANLSVGGNAPIYGSLVANTVSLGGTTEFHQDESLSSKRISGLYGLLKWRELATPSDRAGSLDYSTWNAYLGP